MFFRKKKKQTEISEKDVYKKGLGFFSWIQEFSKKIVVIAFGIYILMDLISLAMVIIAYRQSGDLMFIDTIITEANQTFRDVIGGYILKAATENISKGICVIMERYIGFKEREFDSNHPEDVSAPEESYIEDEDPQLDTEGEESYIYDGKKSVAFQSTKGE